jgi:hypothetical protein
MHKEPVRGVLTKPKHPSSLQMTAPIDEERTMHDSSSITYLEPLSEYKP